MNCPQGKEARQILSDRKKKEQKNKPKPAASPKNQCQIPDCDKPAVACKLCSTHVKQAKRNSLIKLNTANATPEAMIVFVEDLVQIAAENKMDLADVAMACCAMGVTEYQNRYHKGNGGNT